MRRWLRRAVALLVVLALPALAQEPKVVVLQVEGITVRKALERAPGVLEARVEYEASLAHARYDPAKATPESLARTNRGVTRATSAA